MARAVSPVARVTSRTAVAMGVGVLADELGIRAGEIGVVPEAGVVFGDGAGVQPAGFGEVERRGVGECAEVREIRDGVATR